MSTPRTAQVVALPPPYKGQYDRIPVVSIQDPGYCESLTNFNSYSGKLSLRNGDAYYCKPIADHFASTTICLANYNNLTQIAVTVRGGTGTSTIEWWNVSTSTPSLMHSDTGPDPGAAGTMTTLEFGNCIFFLAYYMNGVNAYRYDGTSWTTGSFTGPVRPTLGCSHRNRVYLAEDGTSQVRYGNVDAIAGSTTSVDFKTVTSRGGHIIAILSLSISDSNSASNLLALIFSSGEILAYDGSYPGSSDWRLVGRFQIPTPLGYKATIAFDGDILVQTQAGIVSLKDLFTKGSKVARRESITAPIANRWRQIIKTLQGYNGPGIYDPTNDRLIISFPRYATRAGTIDIVPFFLIYDIARESWLEHRGTVAYGSYQLNHFNYAVYYALQYGTASIFKKEARADFLDGMTDGSTTSGFVYNLRSVPLPISKSGVNKFAGIELITKGDFYGHTSFSIISDLERTTSGNLTLPSLPTTTVQKPFLSMGAEGTYIQWALDNNGSRTGGSTYGCEIYGINAVFETGGLR